MLSYVRMINNYFLFIELFFVVRIIIEIFIQKVSLSLSSACSSFFRALFTNGMNETNDRIVDIHDIPGQTMNAILDYIYTHEIQLNEENIYQILPAANQLQVLELVSLCEKFLYEKLNPENVLGIREFASFYCELISGNAMKDR